MGEHSTVVEVLKVMNCARKLNRNRTKIEQNFNGFEWKLRTDIERTVKGLLKDFMFEIVMDDVLYS